MTFAPNSLLLPTLGIARNLSYCVLGCRGRATR